MAKARMSLENFAMIELSATFRECTPVKPKSVLCTIAAVGFLLNPAAAGSASAADPNHGKELAAQWCAECHAAENAQKASDAAPPFFQFANDAEYTDARLRGWLHDPHPPMPKLELDKRSIEDLIAYIRTLKKK